MRVAVVSFLLAFVSAIPTSQALYESVSAIPTTCVHPLKQKCGSKGGNSLDKCLDCCQSNHANLILAGCTFQTFETFCKHMEVKASKAKAKLGAAVHTLSDFPTAPPSQQTLWDKSAPVIRLLGKSTVTITASTNGDYIDQGAFCDDPLEGDLSHNVVISGDTVIPYSPGSYHLHYNCVNSRGQVAMTKNRVVLVVGKYKCAEVKVSGGNKDDPNGNGISGQTNFHIPSQL